MDAKISHMWASPSTLHLRLEITGKHNSWTAFADCHFPLDDIEPEVIEQILARAGQDGADRHQPGLF